MPAGMIVYSDYGTIQLTDEVINFALLYKGTSATGPSRSSGLTGFTYFTGPCVDIDIPNTLGYPPLFAIYCTVPLTIFECTLVGGNWRFTVMGEYGTAPGAATFEWFAYGPTPNAVPGGNFGLEVRRADGVLAFHSGYSAMRVRWQQGGNGGYTLNTLPAGRKYAIAVIQLKQEWTAPFPAGVWTVNKSTSAVRSLTNGFEVTVPKTTEVRYSAQPTWTGSRSYPDWNYICLDVTNF
jgi:hypothetical protein